MIALRIWIGLAVAGAVVCLVNVIATQEDGWIAATCFALSLTIALARLAWLER